jgi:ABC-type phosphate/phosphonate transport system ATPase subunit
MTAEIQIHELFKKYSNGTEALKGISLEIQKGQFLHYLVQMVPENRRW